MLLVNVDFQLMEINIVILNQEMMNGYKLEQHLKFTQMQHNRVISLHVGMNVTKKNYIEIGNILYPYTYIYI